MAEEELLTLIEEAEQDGAINEEDSELIQSVIDFNDLKVDDILTPRVDIEAVALEDSREEIARRSSRPAIRACRSTGTPSTTSSAS